MSKKMRLRFVLLCVVFIPLSMHAQKENDFELNLELDLVQPILGGYGATVGLENKKWGAGVMGFNTPLSPSSRNFIMKGAENFTVQNWGLELYINYFFKENRQGFHFGGLVSLDGYEMSHVSQSKEQILGVYLVPKIGYRWTIWKKIDWLYLQPALAVPVLVWGNATKITNENIRLSKAIFLPMLTLGVKLPLSPRSN